jgi:hypothetical protein
MILDSPYISGSIVIENSLTASNAVFSGNLNITGDITSTEGFTGSLEGTASIALNAISSSHALNADNAVSSSFAATSSFADSFTVAGEIVAQTLNVQQVTSSVVYSSGSNVFGNSLSNTQQFTGSLQVSGSSHYILGNVGVGVDSPIYPIDVYSTGASTSRVRVQGTSNFALLQTQNSSGVVYIGIDSSTADGFSLGNYTRLFWSSGNYPLAFAVNDAERMRIDPNGNVSFNLPSISGTRELQFPYYNATNAKTIIRATGTSDYRQSLDILMNTAQSDSAPTQVLKIDNSGNVGIGTNNPSLESGGNGLDISNSSYTQLRIQSTLSSAGIEFKPYSGDRWEIQANTSNQWFVYNRTDESYRLVIDGGGNVGIGTTSPNYPFHISSTSVYQAAIKSTGAQYLLIGSENASAAGIILDGDSNGDGAGGDYSYLIHNNDGILHIVQDSPSGTNEIRFGTAGVENKVTIDSSGNVGIGTTSPGRKLDVNGTIGAINSGVDGTFADAFIGVYASNNNEQNAIQTSVSSVAQSSGFRFQVSNGGGSSDRTTVVDFKRDRQIFYTDVGIGTTSPGVKLDVNGEIKGIGQFNLQRSSNGATTIIQFKNEIGANRAHIDFGGTDEELGFYAGAGGTRNLIIGPDGAMGFNYPTLGVRSFMFRAIADRPLAVEIADVNGIHSVFVRPDVSGTNLISSNYLSGGVYLPLSLSGRETAGDFVLATNGNVGIGNTSPSAKLSITSPNGAAIVYQGDKRGKMIGKTIQRGTVSSPKTDLLTISSFDSANSNVYAVVTVLYVSPISTDGGKASAQFWIDGSDTSTPTIGSFTFEQQVGSASISLEWDNANGILKFIPDSDAYWYYVVDVEYVAFDGASVTFNTSASSNED